ncbi:hypothetical protein TrST_g483, partial [Triparma strigata]
DFDQIYEELSGPITLEVQLNPEPIFGSGVIIAPAEGEDLKEGDGDLETQRLSSMKSRLTGDSLEPSLETMNLSDMLQSERMKTEQQAEEIKDQAKEIKDLKEKLKEFKAQPTIVDFGSGKQKQQPTVPIVKFAVEEQKVDEIGGAEGVTGGSIQRESSNPFGNIFYTEGGDGLASKRDEGKEGAIERESSNPFGNIFYNG